MNGMPLLGGISSKHAGAYLIRPETKTKKKKKKKKKTNQLEDLDKIATDVGFQTFVDQQIVLQRRIQSGDLGGGWNPLDQLIDNNS